MRIRWLFVFLMTFGIVCAASAQVADIAGVLPGDRWVYEVTDEVSGELKLTTTVFVLDVSEQEINTRVSTRGAGARQIVYDRNWSRVWIARCRRRGGSNRRSIAPIEVSGGSLPSESLAK